MKNPFKSISPQLLVGIFFGGLGGAVFTWFIHRPNPTIITYAVTSTSLGADATVKGLIPNLKLQIGTEEIPVVHTHSIGLSVPEGEFLDQAEVVLSFRSPVRVYGSILTEAPSLAQRIECKQHKIDPNDRLILGLRCTLSPLKPGTGSFIIVISTDSERPPRLDMAVRNAELVSTDAYLARTHRFFGVPWEGWLVGASSSILFGAGAWNFWLFATFRKDKVKAMTELDQQVTELNRHLEEISRKQQARFKQPRKEPE
jgi:hypothetical protein